MLKVKVFVEPDVKKAAERRSYLIPLPSSETAVLSAARPSPVTTILEEYLNRYGYGQIVDSVDGSTTAHLTNAMLHPKRIVRTLGSRFFEENVDLLPFFDWEDGKFLCLVLEGPDTGSVVVGKDRRVLAPTLEDFMERMADDPRFFLPKWDLSGPAPVRIG